MSKIVKKGYTFDDVLLIPQSSDVLPTTVSTKTYISKNVHLNVPIMSAAMDTVTESKMAIAMAREGGIGIIHKNMSIEEQAEQVRIVKRNESGIILKPYTLNPNDEIRKAYELKNNHNIGGFPVIKDDKLVGILTSRDLQFEHNLSKKVAELMTKRENLIVGIEGITLLEAQNLMHHHRVEKLPIVNKDNELQGMITIRDIKNHQNYPNAAKDKKDRLLVGAAIGVSGDFLERAMELSDKGADIIVIDTAHGHHINIRTALTSVMAKIKSDVIAGNIATPEAAKYLIDCGASAIKVGIGPGSICTTRVIAGIGVPQLTAIMDCAEIANKSGIPVIADGGIKFSGDIAKAIGGGANAVMLGSLFAGTDESPGEYIIYNGRRFKSYRGMGSIGAMQKGSKDRYFQEATSDNQKLVAEGIEGMVPYKGPLKDYLHQLVGGLRAGMGYCGAGSIEELHRKAKFMEISGAGLKESHPHDVKITKETPNYTID